MYILKRKTSVKYSRLTLNYENLRVVRFPGTLYRITPSEVLEPNKLESSVSRAENAKLGKKGMRYKKIQTTRVIIGKSGTIEVPLSLHSFSDRTVKRVVPTELRLEEKFDQD